MAEIKQEKSIYQKLQQDIRLPLSKMNLNKSGYNKHLGYRYFELKDFLPQTVELIAKAGLCTIFSIAMDQNGVEMATLILTDGVNQIPFVIPTAEVPNMAGVFELGSKNTYCKRYLYTNLCDLTESDLAEETNDGKPKETTERKATQKQIEMIRSLYDEENIAKIIEYYQIEKLEDISLKDASKCIERKKQ